jgi:hypothetical protein
MAALIIRGLSIRCFDYSRVKKQGTTANSLENLINLCIKVLS